MLLGGAVYAVIKDLNEPLFANREFHIVSALAGMVVMYFAFRAAATGGKVLARHGRKGDIPRLETDHLVTTGIYACMRHPMLFGLTLLPLGWALLLGSPTLITIIAPLEMLFIVIMVMTFEEAELKRKFGSAYEAYKTKVPAVSFRYTCLKQLFLQKERP
jgi:protein-S-isoprenylcysteine O-methyltransferase Ste14